MISVRDWSLHRQGPKDQARHLERIRQAIRDRLPELISEEAIVAGPPGARIRVPVRSLEQFSFRYDLDQTPVVGEGGAGRQVGDVLVPIAPAGAGSVEGQEILEAEVGEEELVELLWEEMGLPRLRPKGERELQGHGQAPQDRARVGPMSAWDRKRTVYENLKRHALAGQGARVGTFRQEDLRFRSWRAQPREVTQAVVIAMRDVSGSMGEWKKHLSRSFFFWTLAFLRRMYPHVDLAFLCHHTSAREVDEETFFRLGESGGTKVSSAYDLCRTLLRERYPSARWNTYVLHFSDGDNWGEADNRLTLQFLTEDILPGVNLFGYAEVRESGRPSALMRLFQDVDDQRFLTMRLTGAADLLPALRHFFHVEGQGHGGA